MLTAKERKKVIGWLNEYPAGVTSKAWGRSPELADSDSRVTIGHCREYG